MKTQSLILPAPGPKVNKSLTRSCTAATTLDSTSAKRRRNPSSSGKYRSLKICVRLLETGTGCPDTISITNQLNLSSCPPKHPWLIHYNFIDAVRSESLSSNWHKSKSDDDVVFASMTSAIWRLRLNSVYCFLSSSDEKAPQCQTIGAQTLLTWENFQK